MDRASYLRKLHFRAHHRGTREADAIVGGFSIAIMVIGAMPISHGSKHCLKNRMSTSWDGQWEQSPSPINGMGQ